MDPAEVLAWERRPDSNDLHPAHLIVENHDYGYVRVRFRGEWARSWPKKPIKILFKRDRPFLAHRSVNLNSGWRDPAFVRETLAYHLYAACGVPASQSRLVRLDLNSQFRGVYVEVEQVDDVLLRRFGLTNAALFKATSDENRADERPLGEAAAFAAHYDNELQPGDGLGELQKFCRELAGVPPGQRIEFFTRRVDLEKYINYLAATVLVQHWDGFNKNHYLVYDHHGSAKWFVIPWDLDRTLGDHWNGGFDRANLSILLGTRTVPSVTGWNRLLDAFMAEPVLRARFLTRLRELLEHEFTPAKLFPILDRLEKTLALDGAKDRRRWGGADEDLHQGIAGVKRFIERRRAYLQAEVTKLGSTPAKAPATSVK